MANEGKFTSPMDPLGLCSSIMFDLYFWIYDYESGGLVVSGVGKKTRKFQNIQQQKGNMAGWKITLYNF